MLLYFIFGFAIVSFGFRFFAFGKPDLCDQVAGTFEMEQPVQLFILSGNIGFTRTHTRCTKRPMGK